MPIRHKHSTSSVHKMYNSSSDETSTIDSRQFYGEYHGHPIEQLRVLYPQLRNDYDRIIWTAGDSSLDNKYWFRDRQPAVGTYSRVLRPPYSNADVTYWMNYLCENDRQGRSGGSATSGGQAQAGHRTRWTTINTAVEATTLNERCWNLKSQDKLIRDNIQPNDVLVVSIGGNDIALAPAPCTIASIVGLIYCCPTTCLERGFLLGKIPVNDCCCGCGPSLLSCACACPPCLGYFHHLFGVRIQKYIEQLTSKTKPSKILVCMIYFPDETHVPSWANLALGALGYNTNPSKLQLLIRKAFTEATSSIRIPGSEVIPVPLFHALDGKTTRDYIARVEPSSQGGRKMAEYILDMIDQRTSPHSGSGMRTSSGAYGTTTATPLQASYMEDRE